MRNVGGNSTGWAKASVVMLTMLLLASCSPKFNFQPEHLLLINGQNSANPISPEGSGGAVSVSSADHVFTLTHVQYGQPFATTTATSANFSLNTKGLSP